ncbi:MAG TPA: response regulator [Candidatus Mediterraneibacter faecavium]|uniref:Stage 0 sporulation protein A homolog n=1 Tax=Candidatus Mediterraneibacter faecavium TaxID=2838668 RepID=A0A9D2QA24_9FIRM|nr:response regulator [Candidatus Mediterraneibacter faecavium]
MYNILVVDDEKLMRTYLANIIPSLSDAYQVSGIAEDGREAIDLLKKQHYDVVITDIKMPEVDGLNLARYIHENHPDTIVIIVSGYNNFSYARKAIQYQVTDYLLKPLVDKDLKELLDSVSTRLSSISGTSNWVIEDFSFEEKIKKELLASIMDEDTAKTYSLFTQYEDIISSNMMKSCGRLIRCTFDEIEQILKSGSPLNVTTDHLKLNVIINNTAKNFQYTALYNRNGCTWILCSDSTPENLIMNIKKFYKVIASKAASQRLPKLTGLVSGEIHDIMDLPSAAESINSMFPVTLFKPVYPVIEGMYRTNNYPISAINALSENIFSDYLTHSLNQLYKNTKEFWNLFKECQNYSTLLRCGSYLIQLIRDKAQITPVLIHNAYNELTRQINIYLPLGLPEETTAIQILVSTVSCLFTKEFADIIPESMRIVSSAKEYILSHFQDNISLSDVAEYCGVSNCYLSDLFHKTLKEPYSKYLLRIRMEQAARLLKKESNTMRVYEVAEKTGFNSAKHFITVFKKYYGVTPVSYARQNTHDT